MALDGLINLCGVFQRLANLVTADFFVCHDFRVKLKMGDGLAMNNLALHFDDFYILGRRTIALT